MSIIAEIFALALWVNARQRFIAEGIEVTYGSALWMGLAACILAFIG